MMYFNILLLIWETFYFSMEAEGFAAWCSINQTMFVTQGSTATFQSSYSSDDYLVIYFHRRYPVYRTLARILRRSSNDNLTFHIYDNVVDRTQIVDRQLNESQFGVTITISNISMSDNGTYLTENLFRDGRDCWILFVMHLYRCRVENGRMRVETHANNNDENVRFFCGHIPKELNQEPTSAIDENKPVYIYAHPHASLMTRPLVNATLVWLVDGMSANETGNFIQYDGFIWIAHMPRDMFGRNVTYRAIQDNGDVNDANLTLNVTYGPEAPLSFTPNKAHYFLSNGQAMPDISCAVACNPPCTVLWDKNGKDNILSIGKVNGATTGEYTCIATRPGVDIVLTRSLTVQVEDEPEWHVLLFPNKTAYFLTTGDTMPQILCTADCNPPCMVSWGSQSPRAKLLLGEVSKEMSGEYTCIARRNDTDRQAEIRITVYVQDNTAFTVAIAVLASVQAVTTIVVGLCGLYIYMRNNALPCRTCVKGSRPNNSSVRTASTGLKNNTYITETEMDNYEELDPTSRNKPPIKQYEDVESTGKSSKKGLELYENTTIA